MTRPTATPVGTGGMWGLVLPGTVLVGALLPLFVFTISIGRRDLDGQRGAVAMALVTVAFVVWGTTRADRHLGRLAMLGWVVQVLTVAVYYFSGVAQDALLYHDLGVQALEAGQLWDLGPRIGSERWGNAAMASLVGSLYAVTGPSALRGFTVFAAVGVVAKLLMAKAFLDLAPTIGKGARTAALSVFLLPSLTWWLAAISKETVAVLGLALVLSAILRPAGRPADIRRVVLGLLVTSVVRPFLALILVGAVSTFTLLDLRSGASRISRRLIVAGSTALVGLVVLVAAASYLNVDTTVSGLEASRITVSSLSDPGRSNIAAAPIRSVQDVPRGLGLVFVRPFLTEARGLLALLQAIESTVIWTLVLFAWLRSRATPPVRLEHAEVARLQAIQSGAAVYLGLFVYAFAGLYNLGLISRYRSQVWFALLIYIVLALTRTTRVASGRAATAPVPSQVRTARNAARRHR